MQTIWNDIGVQVFGITQNHFVGMQMHTEGYGRREHGGSIIWFQWSATVCDRGWIVTITRPSGRVGEYQGATFNLPLEIATAAGRLL